MKNVQIPIEMFLRVCRYFYLEDQDPELKKAIRIDCEHKLDALMRHQLYTDYKTAESDDDREKARQKYLEAVGIQEGFKWSAEHDRNNRKS